MRQGQPFIFTNLMTKHNLEGVIAWIEKYALLKDVAEPAQLVR
jgi:urease accessory protein